MLTAELDHGSATATAIAKASAKRASRIRTAGRAGGDKLIGSSPCCCHPSAPGMARRTRLADISICDAEP
jgi:hypothetical protein